MVLWATSGRFPNAAFLCVCVDPDAWGTAREFSKLYFATAPRALFNGYIDNQLDFPTFQAQLGCQGFIIFDASHRLVVSRTLPWMQYREGAFRDLEGKLMQVLQPNFENPLDAPLGQQVKVVNLTSAAGMQFNGQVGDVVGSSSNGRYMVKLSDCTKAFRVENLEDATGAPVGLQVKVVGLTSAKGMELNGQVGEVLGGTSSGRYLVKLATGTRSLCAANVQEIPMTDEDADFLKALPAVNHAAMDSQHESCIDALKSLMHTLSVQALRQARDELKHHFQEEEELLRQSGFGTEACGNCRVENKSDFSALGSHIADHSRIIALADDALVSLQNACDASEGAVPRGIAAKICKSFAEHATLYDALYVGKLTASAA